MNVPALPAGKRGPGSRPGRVFSVSQVQQVGQFGMNERAEAFASAAGGFEAALECAGVAFGLGVFLSRSIDRGIGEADHHAPNRSQQAGGFGRAHSALILAQRDV